MEVTARKCLFSSPKKFNYLNIFFTAEEKKLLLENLTVYRGQLFHVSKFHKRLIKVLNVEYTSGAKSNRLQGRN